MLRGLSIDRAANGHFLIKSTNSKGMQNKDFIDLAIDQHDQLADEVDLEVEKSESRDRVMRLSDLYHKTLNRFSLIQCHILFLLTKI